MHFWPFDEPQCVFGVCLPHEQVLYQLLMVLVSPFHVQVWEELHKGPVGVPLDMVLVSQHPTDLGHAHSLVNKKALGTSVLTEDLDEDFLYGGFFDFLDGNADLLCLGGRGGRGD